MNARAWLGNAFFILNERAREAFPSKGWWLVVGQFCMSLSNEKGKAMQETKQSQMVVSEQKFATDCTISMTLLLMLCELHQLLHGAKHALD